MHIVVLAGGIGGARFLRGVRLVAGSLGARVTAVVNVGDDITLHGLRICPDLDSVMYALGGGADPERGWGRAGETWVVKEELASYGAEPAWFGLGDRDLATHLVRTQLLAAGQPLSAVTARLCERWRLGIELLPASDDPVETHVEVEEGRLLHFQEWWIRYRAELPANRFVFAGAERARPAAGVLDALQTADAVLLAPSNPVVSILPILAIPGIREALTAKVTGVSPVIGGSPVRGMADKCLAAIGVPCTAEAVGRMYGADLLGTWLVDTSDKGAEVPGVTTVDCPLWMTDDEATAAIVRTALDHTVGSRPLDRDREQQRSLAADHTAGSRPLDRDREQQRSLAADHD
jgi:LPPG:FO 2-phospho-L-lactate transferase